MSTLLDATFVQSCEAADSPPLTGSILYRAQPLTYAFQSDSGDYIGGGATQLFMPSNATLDVVTNLTAALRINVGGWTGNFAAMILRPESCASLIRISLAPASIAPSQAATTSSVMRSLNCM